MPLEVCYEVATLEVRQWNRLEKDFGRIKPKRGQRVAIFPGDPPNDSTGVVWMVDLANQTVYVEQTPDPSRNRKDRMLELVALGKSNWTTEQLHELIDLAAQEILA